MEEKKGLIKMIEILSIRIEELKIEQFNLLHQTNIGKDIADCIYNVDDLRLIVNTMHESLEHIVQEDSKIFDQMCEMLDTLKEVFNDYENRRN
jgi:hypothetical protein